MKGAIWSMSAAEGNEMLEKVIENYTRYGITIRNKKISAISGSTVEFNNGDYWRVCRASDCSRGVRCNVAYVQRSIPLKVYREIICPTMFDFPFAAVRLWGEGNLHIGDEPLLPF